MGKVEIEMEMEGNDYNTSLSPNKQTKWDGAFVKNLPNIVASIPPVLLIDMMIDKSVNHIIFLNRSKNELRDQST